MKIVESHESLYIISLGIIELSQEKMMRFNNGIFHFVYFIISLLLLLGSGLSIDPFSYDQSLKSEVQN